MRQKRVIRKESYWKKSERILLQSASNFTKCDSYGKVKRNTSTYFYTILSVLPGFIDLFHSTADKKNAC